MGVVYGQEEHEARRTDQTSDREGEKQKEKLRKRAGKKEKATGVTA